MIPEDEKKRNQRKNCECAVPTDQKCYGRIIQKREIDMNLVSKFSALRR
jgi:hypothetical protein